MFMLHGSLSFWLRCDSVCKQQYQPPFISLTPQAAMDIPCYMPNYEATTQEMHAEFEKLAPGHKLDVLLEGPDIKSIVPYTFI